MFREMRRKKNMISQEAAKALLHNERRGVLAVQGDGGYPYAVPVNFLYDEKENRILFHGAKAGHKVDALRACDKVCFTVFGNEMPGEPAWAPHVQSTVVFGRCRLLEDRDESMRLAKSFAMKYYPDEAAVDEEIRRSGKAVQMFVIEVEHLSGKEIQEI